jgi:hypothetical protein
MIIDYTAKRSLKTGHIVDTAYQIDVDLNQFDRGAYTKGSQQEAISGNTVTIVQARQKKYSITTVLIDSSTTPDIDDMREFLDSVMSGETFQIDSENFILASISSPYSETRNEGYFRYSFTARQL